jgi:hypothetical protein
MEGPNGGTYCYRNGRKVYLRPRDMVSRRGDRERMQNDPAVQQMRREVAIARGREAVINAMMSGVMSWEEGSAYLNSGRLG